MHRAMCKMQHAHCNMHDRACVAQFGVYWTCLTLIANRLLVRLLACLLGCLATRGTRWTSSKIEIRTHGCQTATSTTTTDKVMFFEMWRAWTHIIGMSTYDAHLLFNIIAYFMTWFAKVCIIAISVHSNAQWCRRKCKWSRIDNVSIWMDSCISVSSNCVMF